MNRSKKIVGSRTAWASQQVPVSKKLKQAESDEDSCKTLTWDVEAGGESLKVMVN